MLFAKKEQPNTELVKATLQEIKTEIDNERVQGISSYSQTLKIPQDIRFEILENIVSGEGETQTGSDLVLFPTNLDATEKHSPLLLVYDQKSMTLHLKTEDLLPQKSNSPKIKVNIKELFQTANTPLPTRWHS